jgi:hypothetical protein
MPMTDYLQNAVINATVRNTSYTSPTTVYASLYSVAPTESSAGTEITGNGYSRQSVTFSAPSLGIAVSNAAVTFTCTTSNWPPVIAFGIMDASTSGNLMYYKTIVSRQINVGDSLVFATGDISIAIT